LRGSIVKVAVATVAIFSVAAVAAVAGEGPGLAPSAANVAGPVLRPTASHTVLPRHYTGDVRKIPRGVINKDEPRPEPQVPNDAPGGAVQADAAVQTVDAAAPAPNPSASFNGLDRASWGAGWPPDTNGDVGPKYYVQTVNTSIGIFDKATGSRVAAFTFNGLFSSAGTGTACDNANRGDPVVLYDPIGDRWIVTDFAWGDYTTGAMYECMAVSATGDPVNGGWHFYAWKLNNGGIIPDYPKLGVWPDGIYMSTNNFSTTSGQFQNVQVWAFDRVAMEAGQAAKSVTFTVPSSVGGVGVFSLLPSNTRMVTGLPPAGAPNYFASIYGSYNIRVWRFHVDWTNTANSTFTGPTNATIGTFNVGPSSVPERQGNNLDSLSYRLMMQNQYTNIDGTESLWLTHTVGSGGSQNLAQVRWYQLAVTGGSVASAPKQQATWAPDSKNRFMPSLAVDKTGDMAIGYAVSDATMSPAIRYAGRLASDPAGVLGQGETSLVEGSGYQCCSFSNGQLNTRWGDYSAMSIDPDGCTFWYTNEYTNAQPTSITGDNWLTRIGSFRFPSCGGSTQPAAPTITSFAPSNGPAGTSVTVTGTNFTGATAVSFNGVAATFAVASATSITATVPTGASTGPITVTTGGGTATTSSSFSVTVQTQAPTITSFAPASGPVGTSVTLTGTSFTGATAVSFNGTSSSSFSVTSPTSIVAAVPAGASTGPIGVTTPGGTATSASSFSVTVVAQAPTVTSFSPASGTVGTSVTISGTSLAGATSVKFNGTAASFTVKSATSITAAVAAGASTGPISVTTAGGTATSSSSFTVTASTAKAPIISSFTPVSGRVGSSVAIAGANFTGATSVKFNGVSASFNVPSSTRISALVPTGATTGRITVTTPGGTGTSSGTFRVG
jgi:hypothetical protein